MNVAVKCVRGVVVLLVGGFFLVGGAAAQNADVRKEWAYGDTTLTKNLTGCAACVLRPA